VQEALRYPVMAQGIREGGLVNDGTGGVAVSEENLGEKKSDFRLKKGNG